MRKHETFGAAVGGRAPAPAGVAASVAASRPGLTTIRILNTAVSISPRRVRLWSELVVLFVGVPLLLYAYFDDILAWGALGTFSLIAVLGVLGIVAAVLLAITPGFRFSTLLEGPVFREWKLILFCTALAAVVCTVAVFVLVPGKFLSLPLSNTTLWALLLPIYSLFSALPQELIYRTLFFERYGALFPGTMSAVAANGAAFGFGHLLYMHPITIALTAVGGALIGWAYLTRGRSVLLTWVLHSAAGCLIFTSGLGVYFYAGSAGPL